MSKKKSKAKAKPAKPDRSKIIEQAVIYVQHIAAYDAGFTVDLTGNSEHCGKGGPIKKARRAMMKLIGLSPHTTAGAAPLSAVELYAKAGVLAAMYGLRKMRGRTISRWPTSGSLPARYPTSLRPITRCPNEAPAPIDQKAQPAAVGRSREAAEAITTRGAGSGPRPYSKGVDVHNPKCCTAVIAVRVFRSKR
jgi:hypothetical protein